MKNLKISVITPSFNSADYIERAIKSVLEQNYENFEHIIMDNCSTDGTIDILKKYPHIIWKSEKDTGQSNAMNRGFELSTGDIIVYLNCDDYFEKNIFPKINECFIKNENVKFVVGDAFVHLINGNIIRMKPQYLFKKLIYFWEGWNKISENYFISNFPNNPVQYFYKREVQEKFSFNEKNHYTMDLEFLANVLKIYEKNIRYIEEIFGNYILLDNAKSIKAQKEPSYWDKSTFSYIDELIKFEPWYKNYFEDREKGFISRIDELIKNKKRVLVFSPVPIYPSIQGNRKRMVNMLNKIKENDVELFLVLFGSDWIDGKNISKEQIDMDYKKLFAKVFHYPKKRDHSSLFGKNIDIDDAYEDGLGEYISNICKDYKIDIYLHNYIFQSKVFEFLPYSVIKILDTHDKFKDKYKLAKWYSYSEEEESKGISRADIILSIQDEEKKYFESITNKEVVTVGHLSESNFLDKEYENLKVIGIISSGHIRDFLAVEKFIQKFIEVVPEDLTLNIAGMVCEKLEPLYKHPQINYLGLVNDLKDFYESINLCVIPPEDGTGLKIKSVEALSYGVPIISTKHGFIGIK